MKYFTALILLLSIFCKSGNILAQANFNQIGGRSLAVSGSSITFQDVWSQSNNQAGLANLKGISFGFGFQNEFMIKELSTKSVAFALPLKSGVFGLNYYNFGFTAYNENKIGFAYAKKLGKRFAVGIQLDYLYTHIEGEYGNRGITAGEIGLLIEPIDNLMIGAHLNNVWRTKRTALNEEYLPTIFKIGASYKLYEKALIGIEFEKDMDLELVFKAGLELELIKKLYFRAGIATNPNIFSFGPGYTFGPFQVDLAFKKHPVLGFSQGISITYSFKDRI